MSFSDFQKYYHACQIIPDNDTEFSYQLYKKFISDTHMTHKDYTLYLKKQISLNAPKVIKYQLFTFTTDPAKKNTQKQEDYIKSILKRKQNLQITNLWYCKEHEDTNLHYHVGIGSTKSIPPNAFKQYASLYGSVNKSKYETTTADGVTDYTQKESNSTKLL